MFGWIFRVRTDEGSYKMCTWTYALTLACTTLTTTSLSAFFFLISAAQATFEPLHWTQLPRQAEFYSCYKKKKMKSSVSVCVCLQQGLQKLTELLIHPLPETEGSPMILFENLRSGQLGRKLASSDSKNKVSSI